MPSVRKLSLEEVRTIENRGKSQRKLVEEEYDRILSEYAEGDYGEAELDPSENRLTVRNRLKAAAQRRGLSIDFKRTKGDMLRFKFAPAQASDTTPRSARSTTSTTSKGRGRKKKGS